MEATWGYLRTDESRAPLVNRATQGIYPPGSTFKIVDCIELLQEDPDALDTFSYNCEDGTYTFNDESIHALIISTMVSRTGCSLCQFLQQCFPRSW